MFKNTQKVIRSAGQSLLSNNRQFFGIEDLKRTRKELIKVLESEIEGEIEDASRKQYIEDFLNKNGWKIEAHPSLTKIQLVKQVDSTHVRVVYNAKAPQSFDPETEGNEESDSQGEQNIFEFFTVLDKNIPKKLVINFMIMDGDMSINRVFVTDNADAIIDSDDSSAYLYSGPEYDTLAETLQRRIQKYVQQFGINEEFGNFLEDSSHHHEANLYKRLLTDLKDVLQ